MDPIPRKLRQRHSLPSPEGLDITLAALNTSRETIQEAERVGRVGNLF
jgi:hypothetical protein